MTVSIPLEIQRLTGLDDRTTTRLRTFEREWRCGTQFIFTLLHAGHRADLVGVALTEVLGTYQRMCREGISDFVRLRVVLGHVLQTLGTGAGTPSAEQIGQWCRSANVPDSIRECLIHG